MISPSSSDVSHADLSGLDTAALVEISEAAKRSATERPNPRNLVVVGHEQEALLVKLYQKIAEMRGSPIAYELHYSLAEAYRALGIADPFAEQKSSA